MLWKDDIANASNALAVIGVSGGCQGPMQAATVPFNTPDSVHYFPTIVSDFDDAVPTAGFPVR